MTAAAALAAAQSGGESISRTQHWRDDVRRRALARRLLEAERSPRLRRIAWLAALIVHLLLIVALRISLHRPTAVSTDEVLRVDLIEGPSAPPPASPAPSQRLAAPAPNARRPTPSPTDSEPLAADSTPQPHLLDPDGNALLPRDIEAQIQRMHPRPDFIPRHFDPSPLLLAQRPLKVRPNHFAASWAGTDGQPLSRSIWQPLTFVTKFTAPWGGRYACGWILILVACGDVPDKPWSAPQTWRPAGVLDER